MVSRISRKRDLDHLGLDDQDAMDDNIILGGLDDHLLGGKRMRLDVMNMDSNDADLPSHHLHDSDMDLPSNHLVGHGVDSDHFSASDHLHGSELSHLPDYKILQDEVDIHDMMQDSGSDCVPMESGGSLDAEDGGLEEEPYIDVVSEDSAIHEEDVHDDYTAEGTSYTNHRMSPMHNLISSHDDSAIIKSEIFDPAYDEMNQMLSSGGDYEHSFLDGMETSDFLKHEQHFHTDQVLDSLSDRSSFESLSSPGAFSGGSQSSDCVSDNTFSQEKNTSTSCAASAANAAAAMSVLNSVVQSNSALTSVGSHCDVAGTSSTNSQPTSTSPVLTTPVFIAQGAPGPAGQTNSIITTHLARLVPSPDGNGYILHLGLNPSSSAAPGSASVAAPINAATTGGIQISTTSAVTSPHVTAVNTLNSISSFNPASLNITITPAMTQGLGLTGAGNRLAGNNNNTDVQTPIQAADLSKSSSSPLGGSTLETDHDGNFVLKNNASNAEASMCNEVMSVCEPVGTSVDSSLVNQQGLFPTGLSGASVTSVTSAPLVTEAECKLLDSKSEAQIRRLMQPANTAVTSVSATATKTKSSKRRNSRELRELVELEMLHTLKSRDDLDRFVICSDGPMNCALCGYNTGSYSSFKSHIICSHPCWRITKKLSRNRLLVEKSVKVSIPVANFSVPNPVPAVPIQPRVHAKRGKRGTEKSSEKASADKNSGDGSTSASNKESSKDHKHSRHREKNSSSNSSSSRGHHNNHKDDKSTKSEPTKRSSRSSRNSAGNRNSSSSTGTKGSASSATSATSSETAESLTGGSSSSHLTGRQKQIIERNKRVFRCTKCMRLFVFEGSVVNHIMDQHGLKKAYDYLEVSNDHGKTFGPMFRCPHGNCCFTSSSANELEKHKSEKHTLQKVYRCQICGYSADSTKAVKEHAAKIHPQKSMMYGLTD